MKHSQAYLDKVLAPTQGFTNVNLYIREKALMMRGIIPLETKMQASSKVLPSQRVKVSRGEIHIVKERCKQCNLCIDFCPTQVLQVSDEVNEKGYQPPKLVEEPEKGKICLACGFCQVICPEYAIWVEKKKNLAEGEKSGKDDLNR